MEFPKHVFVVRATVEAAHEAEFNRWYDEEHLPDAARSFVGCIGAARYKVVHGDASHQYMTVYAFESGQALEATMKGPELKRLVADFDKSVGAFTKRSRTTYARVA